MRASDLASPTTKPIGLFLLVGTTGPSLDAIIRNSVIALIRLFFAQCEPTMATNGYHSLNQTPYPDVAGD